ncbi:MAG: FecR domain-containing protein [Bacteroides sp.]|nr:FecR domain-containing protein [Bacteroides sp.]
MEISDSEKKVLDIMQNPRRIKQEDIKALQEDELQDCKLLNDISVILEENAILAHQNVEKELQYFYWRRKQKVQRHLKMWLLVTGTVAAMLVGVLFFLNLNSEASFSDQSSLAVHVVMKADSLPQEILLEVEDEKRHHEIYTLDKITEAESMVIRQADTMHTKEINYFERNSSPAKVATQTHILHIPYGQMFKLVLSDGTEVFLNAGSRLIYPTRFLRKERIVTLEGEAYFKVAKDKTRPFIVQSGNVQTRVLGTEFNISSYSASDVHVTLIEGSVQVETSDSLRIITPGQDLCVRKDGTISVEEIDLHSYMYWRDGYFYFDNLPLVEVLQSIGRWYNVGVEFHNTQAMDCKVHFVSERFQGLDHTLTLLNRMEKAIIRLEGNNLIVE